MNYERIYRELIADRRANPPSEDEYVEVHHILPRCMGGGNESENLIRLRPEDHFFAHLLLAHIHGSREMWAAVVLMNGNRWHTYKRARKTYGLARRRLNEVSRGLDHPCADRTEYTFYHVDGDVFEGTRIDFGAYADVPPGSVNSLVRGNIETAYSWCMKPISREELVQRKSETARSAGVQLRGFVRDKELRQFYNRDSGVSVIATQVGMYRYGYLPRTSVSAIVNGTRAVSDGWCLIENSGWAYDHAVKRGELSHMFDPSTYAFVNDVTGEARLATQNEMGRMYNSGDGRPFGEVARGRRSGWRGWRLSSSKPARVMGVRHTLHKNGEVISGTQRELCNIIGVTPMAVSNVITGKKMHTRGWMLKPANDNVQYSLPLSA